MALLFIRYVRCVGEVPNISMLRLCDNLSPIHNLALSTPPLSKPQPPRPPPSLPLSSSKKQYQDEMDLSIIMELIDNELSEPYSIFTYRYFLFHWPHLCFIAKQHGKPIGTVVSKVDVHRGKLLRGYIAMLTVVKDCRSLGIGSMLVRMTIEGMIAAGTEEVALEAEVTNDGAIKLYEKLGFIRAKRLRRYYLNGNDAYRLKLLLPGGEERREDREAAQELQQLSMVGAGGT